MFNATSCNKSQDLHSASEESAEENDVQQLEAAVVIGFDGSIAKGFIVHPDKTHVVYPIGNKVVIQEWESRRQTFLSGHTNAISAIDLSRSGKYVASGQVSHVGFKSSVIIWDFHKREKLHQHEIHKLRVQEVKFSPGDRYCLSLGGQDFPLLVVWDMVKGRTVCGCKVSREDTTLITMSTSDCCFLTAGHERLTFWRLDETSKTLNSAKVPTSKLKRRILCMLADDEDRFCYCGTATGDLLKILLGLSRETSQERPPILADCLTRIVKDRRAQKESRLYSRGITALCLVKDGLLVIAAGDGTVELVRERKEAVKETCPSYAVKNPAVQKLAVLRSTNVHASVTSLQLLNPDTLLAATVDNEIYSISLDTFNTDLLVTAHSSVVYDIAFPKDFSDIFATAGTNDVRVWSATTTKELLRIRVQNFSCSSLLFAYDGKSILTAWNDGVIRSFTPLTGRLIYAILNAHNKGVSVVALCRKQDVLISGGCEGQVRLWKLEPEHQQLVCTLKEHKGPISSIHVNRTDTEAVSASTDGSCIIWDLVRRCRRQILFGNTLFMCAKFYPNGLQIVTGGSDRKLAYWEVYDGSLVRELEGATFGAINAVDVSEDGQVFVSGGNDQVVRLWRYLEGDITHVGLGHSSVITAACFSPDGKTIVTSDASGSIFIWKSPPRAQTTANGQ